MHHRIAPRDTSPTHDVEVHYFNALMVSVKRLKYNIPLEDDPYPFTCLLSYEGHRSQIAACEHYNGDIRTLQKQQPPHHDALVIIDAFVDKLMKGLHEGDAVKHITTDDIETTEKALWIIRNCRTRTTWYR